MNNSERTARIFTGGLLLGLLLAVGAALWLRAGQVTTVHPRMPERGGWLPGDLKAISGQPLLLRLVSDDVVHGFAIGQNDQPEVELLPGKVEEVRLVFERPGKYTFYCTRWCGINRWRMRGTIEVSGEGDPLQAPSADPLYMQLGLDIDAKRQAASTPAVKPSAERGAALAATGDVTESLPAGITSLEYYQTHTPEQAWQALRAASGLARLSDQQIWDLTAHLWERQSSPAARQEGASLYVANCAACHGETGQGDGVFAAQVAAEFPAMPGHEHSGPTAFTDGTQMLAASPALLQGKILRGGMGTGMPYWGPIFTDEQTWALVAYLWTFQFDLDRGY